MHQECRTRTSSGQVEPVTVESGLFNTCCSYVCMYAHFVPASACVAHGILTLRGFKCCSCFTLCKLASIGVRLKRWFWLLCTLSKLCNVSIAPSIQDANRVQRGKARGRMPAPTTTKWPPCNSFLQKDIECKNVRISKCRYSARQTPSHAQWDILDSRQKRVPRKCSASTTQRPHVGAWGRQVSG